MAHGDHILPMGGAIPNSSFVGVVVVYFRKYLELIWYHSHIDRRYQTIDKILVSTLNALSKPIRRIDTHQASPQIPTPILYLILLSHHLDPYLLSQSRRTHHNYK